MKTAFNTLFNAGIIGLLVARFGYGIEPAGNLLLFYVWFCFVVAALMYLMMMRNIPVSIEGGQHGYVYKAWSWGVFFCTVGTLVWHAWFWSASAYVFAQLIFIIAEKHNDPNEHENTGEAKTGVTL